MPEETLVKSVVGEVTPTTMDAKDSLSTPHKLHLSPEQRLGGPILGQGNSKSSGGYSSPEVAGDIDPPSTSTDFNLEPEQGPVAPF